MLEGAAIVEIFRIGIDEIQTVSQSVTKGSLRSRKREVQEQQ
jgi:hypothetical protein